MSDIGLYIRTLRYLRPRQLVTRIARRVVRPRVSDAPHPGLRELERRLIIPVVRAGGWRSPATVRLLNIEREFDGAVEWRPADLPRLWTYTLNYFEDLPRGAREHGHEWASDLVDAWIRSNPPGTPDSWDPYPTSQRITNWIKWMLLSREEQRDGVLDSLALQARWLEKRLEYDIAANHLFANAAALTAAGFIFGGEEGDRWLTRGLHLLRREMDEQVPGESHYERSPMYHAIVLEQVLDVLNLHHSFPSAPPATRVGFTELLEERALAMLRWLAGMTHPDGGFAFFNDCTLGSAPNHAELAAYAVRLGLDVGDPDFEPVEVFTDSCFVRALSEDERTLVLFDAGLPSPSYQPGHAHSEALSFELSRDGRRVFVNSGVSTYEEGEERLRQRRTAAHNTVRIDGEEQCELWSSHRCGRRDTVVRRGGGVDWQYGEHHGYAFLPGRPTHRRELRVSEDEVLLADRFGGSGEHRLEWFFHLHPDFVAAIEGRSVALNAEGRVVGRLVLPEDIRITLEPGTWHPGFNLTLPNITVRAEWRGQLPLEFETAIRWE